MQVAVLEVDLAALSEALMQGRCDVALSYRLGLDNRFSTTLLERVPPHVLVHEGRPAAKQGRPEISLKELEGEPCVTLDLPYSREYYEQLYASLGLIQNIRHSFSGFETVRSFVAHGHGYALLNQRPHGKMTYSGGKVVALGVTDNLAPLDVVLVRLAGVTPTKGVLAFEEACINLYLVKRPD